MQNGTKSQSMSMLVQRWQQSGKTQKQFSEENHIKLATFIYWLQKHRQTKDTESGFASLTISPETEVGTIVPKIEIELSGGIVVRIY